MPLTPFHFGPGALLTSAAPTRISFLAFCATNVVVDVEPGYYLLQQEPPWHRFMHTLVGASLAIAVTIVLALLALHLARRVRLPNSFDWQSLTAGPVVLGAVLGGYSHVLLDALKHADVQPFAPWSTANPAYDLLSLSVLHGICVACAGVALIVLWYQRRSHAVR